MTANFDIIICADSGFNSLADLDISVDYIVGDMDSITQENLDMARDRGVCINSFEHDKDMTDGEIAVRMALEKGADNITIWGGREGRLDHIFSSVDLLRIIPPDVSARYNFLDDMVYLIREGESMEVTDPTRIYSILPSCCECKVSMIGFKWPLDSEVLVKGTTRGIHNEIIGKKGIIKSEKGELIVIVCDHG